MSIEWSQTVIFFLTPLFFMILFVETDDDDGDGPDSGLMSPILEGI